MAYSKRTASTKAKTYADYIAMREEYASKGYALQPQMSEQSFYAYYERLRLAKRAGEIKSQPWQVLKAKEHYTSTKQAENLAKAASAMYGENVTRTQIRKMSKAEILVIGEFLNSNKKNIFGGRYE